MRNRVCLELILLVLLALSGVARTVETRALPGEPLDVLVYEEDFTAYTYKDYTNNAEWAVWTGSLHLSPVDHVEQQRSTVVALGDGTFAVAWEDYRNGNWDVYIQRLDEDGNRLWSQDRRVNSDTTTTAQWTPALAAGDSGDVLIAWEDGRNGNYDVYAQRLDRNGAKMWDYDRRVNSDTGTTAQGVGALSSDGSDGAFVAWGDGRNGNNDVYAQRLNENGNKLWTNDVQVNTDESTSSQSAPDLSPDGNGGVFIAWQDGRNDGYLGDIYAQRIGASGNRLWATETRVNSDVGSASQRSPALTPDGSGGAFVVWKDGRNDDYFGDIYAQRIDSTGSRLWSVDIRVNSDIGTNSQDNPALVSNDGGGAFVAWADGRQERDEHVYAQLLDGVGNRVWDQDVKAGTSASYPYPALASVTGTGEAVVTWEHPDEDIYAYRLSSQGNCLWDEGVQVNTGTGAADQYNPAIVPDNSGGATLLWVDARASATHGSGAVRAQRFNEAGTVVWPNAVELVAEVGDSSFDHELDAAGGGNTVGAVWGGVRAQMVDSSGNRKWVDSAEVRSGQSWGHSPEIAVLSDGSALVAWQDNRNTTYAQPFDVYAQRIGFTGGRVWEEDVRVNDVIGSGYQYLYSIDIAANAADQATVVWPDGGQFDTVSVVAQRIDRSGELQWGTGRRVSLQSSFAWNPSVAVESNGRSYVAWMASEGSTEVRLQALDTAGHAVWQTEALVASDGCAPLVLADKEDKAIVVWVSENRIHAQRYNVDGSEMWGEDLLVSEAEVRCSLGRASLAAAAGDSEYFFVAWSDERNGTGDVFVRRFDLAGQPQWPGELNPVPSDFFYLASGNTRSRTVRSAASDIVEATLTADYKTNGGGIQFYVTNDDGEHWAKAIPGVTHVFTTTGSDLRWRAELTADPVWNRTPIVDSLRIEYSTDAPGGDDYEPDDTCAQAQPVQVNGVAQQHTFHQYEDDDWIWFDAQAGTTYLIQTANTGDRADTVLELYDQCGEPPTDSDDNPFGPGASISFVAPSSGIYYVRVRQHDGTVYGPQTDYDLSVRTPQSTGAAIIVAGRLREHDDVQPIINATANLAYQTLLESGFSAEDVQYLNTDLTQPGADGVPSEANVRDAIQDWARTRVGLGAPLWLYLADHGNVDRFHNEIDQVVTAGELNLWLSNLEATSGVDQINVVIDACFSGSFIDTHQSGAYGLEEVSGHGRAVVASTTSRYWAYAPRMVPDQPTPLMYFSDGFWHALGDGQSLWSAFLAGRATVDAGGVGLCGDYDYVCQRPWLDDNGDAWFDNSDGELSQGRGLAATFAGGTAPYIESVSVGPASDAQATIEAQVRDDGDVERVWARIFAPSFELPQTDDGSVPVVQVPEVDLESDGGDAFSVSYDGFSEEGVYQVVVYAMDEDGNTATPKWVLIGGKAVYLPLVLRGSRTGQ